MASIIEKPHGVNTEIDLDAEMRAVLAAGVSLVPVGNDKRPIIKWKPYQENIASVKMLDHWLASHTAFAAVCGKVSGGLEIIDIDDNPGYPADDFYNAWRNDPQVDAIVKRYDLPVQRTGGGGLQIAFRSTEPGHNEKLAWISDATQPQGRSVAIETRGEGGYAVIAPSVLDEKRRYTLLQGSFADVPTIAIQERSVLIAAARKLCLMPVTVQDMKAAVKEKSAQDAKRYNGSGSVISAYNAAHKIADVLAGFGYTPASYGGRLVRPNGHSPSVHISDADNVAFPWSSNDPLHKPNAKGNPYPVNPFDAFCYFEHGNDTSAAVKAAAQRLGIARPQATQSVPQRNIDPATGEITDDAPVVVALDDVLTAIEAIKGNADLKPADRQKQIVRGLSTAIGDIDRSLHVEVIAALEGADAGFTQTGAKDFVRAAVADAKKRNKAAERVRKEAARQNLLAVRAKKGKASIDTGNRQLSDIVDEALQVLIESNADNPTVFVRGGALVRIVQDERGHYGIQEISSGALMGKLAEVADWETVGLDSKGNPESKAVFPPRDVVNTILAAGAWPGLPALSGIVNAPVFSRDGVLHDQPGYNKATRLYYTGGVKVGDTSPTPENIQRAKDLILNNLLVDFPFKDDASRAHAVAYLLLPFVRDMIDGPTPVHDVDSPTAGTGKGKLVNACAYPFLGYDVPTQPAVEDDNEWRKIITTRLQNGDLHMVIDNVNFELNSGALASAFTQPIWTDRTLGANRAVTIPIRTIWAITANNIRLSHELTRRCIWVRLDANAEKPHERTGFKHPNLMAWAKQNRGALATAALTFVRAWVDSGKKRYTGRAKGSYEEWAGVMGGILETVGIPGFLENEAELYERVFVRNDMMGDFVRAWAEKFGSRDASAYSLFELASYADADADNALGDWRNLLGGMLTSQKQRGRQTQLGGILGKSQDTVIAGYKIVFAKAQKGMNYWRLEATGVEPQTKVLPANEGSTQPLPPVDTIQNTNGVEPSRTFPPHAVSENNFFSCLENDIAEKDNKKKNNCVYSNGVAEVLLGSTQDGATTCERGVEPQSEVLPISDECEVGTWEV